MTCIFEQLFLPSREGGNLTTQVPATWKPLIYHAAAAGSLYSAAHTRMRRRRLFKLSLILILGVDERPSLLNGFCPPCSTWLSRRGSVLSSVTVICS